MNELLAKGVAVRRVDKLAPGLKPGDFVIPSAPEATLSTIAKETGVDFRPLNTAVSAGIHDVKKLRIGMYQRYGGGNIDEGWTPLTLERFSFISAPLLDAESRKVILKQSST